VPKERNSNNRDKNLEIPAIKKKRFRGKKGKEIKFITRRGEEEGDHRVNPSIRGKRGSCIRGGGEKISVEKKGAREKKGHLAVLKGRPHS